MSEETKIAGEPSPSEDPPALIAELTAEERLEETATLESTSASIAASDGPRTKRRKKVKRPPRPAEPNLSRRERRALARILRAARHRLLMKHRLPKEDLILTEGIRSAWEKTRVGKHVASSHWKRLLHLSALRMLRSQDAEIVADAIKLGMSFQIEAEEREGPPDGSLWQRACDQARMLERQLVEEKQARARAEKRADRGDLRLEQMTEQLMATREALARAQESARVKVLPGGAIVREVAPRRRERPSTGAEKIARAFGK